MLAAVCAVASFGNANAGQPQQIQTVSDRLGRFTINFPISWVVKSATFQPRRPSAALAGDKAVSIVVGTAPSRADEHWPTSLAVVAAILKRPMTPSEMAQEVRLGPGPDGEPPPATKLLEEGNTRLAERPAYYRYLSVHDDDTNIDVVHLFGFLPVDRVGYVIWGGIKKRRLKRDSPIVLQIVESLHPAAPVRGYPFRWFPSGTPHDAQVTGASL